MYYQKSSRHVVVKKHSWHYRLFKWSLGVIDAWSNSRGKYVEKYTYGTTLTHYLRVLLLYMPLAILSNLLLYIWILLSLFIVPIQVGGVLNYLAFLGVFFLLSLILFALGYFISVWAKSENSILDLFLINLLDIRVGPRKRELGLIGLFKRWLTFKFTGINPNVTFTEGSSNE